MKPWALIFVAAGILIFGVVSVAPFGPFAQLGVQEYRAATSTKTSVAKAKAVTLLFAGDVMLGRHIETLSKQQGADYPFRRLGSLLADPDVAIINLEGPILQNHQQTPPQGFSFSFPTSTAKLLKDQGIDIAALANNHTGDKGPNGYSDTVRFLTAAGLDSVGHPNLISEEYVLRQEMNGQKLVFVAFNFTNPNFSTSSAHALVTALRKSEPQESFIVSMIHGGNEYELTSHKTQQAFYRGLIDAGADLIIGHHPHAVQEVELYNGKPIFYSLGNFIFDQYFSKDVQQGLVVKLELSQEYASYELVPVKITRGQPEVMAESEAAEFLASLGFRSPTVSSISKNQILEIKR